MKIVSIVGARPNFIKLGPLSKEIKKQDTEVILHTGQHYDHEMSNLLFNDLGIPQPDYNLGINQGDAIEQISRMLVEISQVLAKEKPDITIVYGDTNSTLAGAMASIHNRIPCAHIEAGPRNGSILIREMFNRLIVDKISTLLFCATRHNLQTLAKEGLGDHSFFVGDQMYDAYLQNIPLAKKKKSILDKLGLTENNYHLATCHRAETTDDKQRLTAIVNSFVHSDKPILFPVHPRTEKMLKHFGLLDILNAHDHIKITKSLGYLEFLMYEYYADKILTDSGGVQREAFFMNKPCINFFDETAWPEIEQGGWQIVVGLNESKIIDAINSFAIPDKKKPDIFGNGDASKKTLALIKELDFNTWDKFDI